MKKLFLLTSLLTALILPAQAQDWRGQFEAANQDYEQGRMKEAESVLESYQQELKNIDQAMEDEKMALVDKWMEEAYNITEVKLTPTKQNIRITNFGILWKP